MKTLEEIDLLFGQAPDLVSEREELGMEKEIGVSSTIEDTGIHETEVPRRER